MNSPKYRVLLVCSQPIQSSNGLQLLAQDPIVEMLMAYCSLPDPKLWQGSESINKHVFDTQVLDGYPWVYVPNYSPLPSLNKAFGLVNLGIVKLVPQFDCCIVYGDAFVSFWLAIIISKLLSKPLLLSTDATYLEAPSGGTWKIAIKRLFLPFLYKYIADGVLVPSTASKRFLQSLDVEAERIFITPYVVDNEGIAKTAQLTNRNQIRAEWQVPIDALVVVFCAKFIPRKRPQDLVKAFALANVANSYLVLVGDGPLKEALQEEVEQLGITERVKFLGFVKYSFLPQVYTSSDLLVHPAEWEPYGLPVNEAMVCGIPVVVSDRVGAGYDLVQEGVTGFTYPSGDVDALASVLKTTLGNHETLKQMGTASIERMKTWSFRENVEAHVEAIKKLMTEKNKKVHKL
jgi:glycosyltransferase involved in cell wall biosynthesis